MPDISMCQGENIEVCNTCYRKNAEPNPHWQAYFVVPPSNPDGSCDHYWRDECQPTQCKSESSEPEKQPSQKMK